MPTDRMPPSDRPEVPEWLVDVLKRTPVGYAESVAIAIAASPDFQLMREKAEDLDWLTENADQFGVSGPTVLSAIQRAAEIRALKSSAPESATEDA